jgi:hypothetical protein
MASPDEPRGFEEFKQVIESSPEPQRTQCVHEFVARYLQPENDTLRRIARRQFFEQLRPLSTVEDVLSRVGEKLERRLRTDKLRLTSEKKFISSVTRMIQLTLIDINRLRPGSPPAAHGLGSPDEGGSDVADRRKGPGSMVRDEDAATRLREVLRELLQADEWFLIRRHDFEGASYAEIADEVFPPAPEPPTPEQVRGRADTIRMRIQRIRQNLAEKEEDLLLFLEDT